MTCLCQERKLPKFSGSLFPSSICFQGGLDKPAFAIQFTTIIEQKIVPLWSGRARIGVFHIIKWKVRVRNGATVVQFWTMPARSHPANTGQPQVSQGMAGNINSGTEKILYKTITITTGQRARPAGGRNFMSWGTITVTLGEDKVR